MSATALDCKSRRGRCAGGARGGIMRTGSKKARWILAVCGVVSLAAPARADVVTDWNKLAFRVSLIGGASALNAGRVAAIVHAAVFDALNGIDRRYTPIHVAPPDSCLGASRPAAVVEAAYEILSRVYGPPQRRRTSNQHWTAATRRRWPTSDRANAPRRSTRASRVDMRSPRESGTGDRPTASTPRFRRLSGSPPRDNGAARQPIPIQACCSRWPACSTRR
jgi:hypothetical protein